MIRQIAILVIGSLIIVLSMVYARDALQYLMQAHDWVSFMLKDVFSGGQIGNIARELIALLALPLAIGIVAAAVYYMMKRRWFPYFMEVVWTIWLVQVSAIVITFAG